MRSRTLFAAVALAMLAWPARALPPTPACDLTGEWIGEGIDDGRTRWTFPMHVTQTAASFTATIEWTGSNGHSGTERIVGTVDCAARRLEARTEVVTGEHLVPGLYRVGLSSDFSHMTGRWYGPNVLPGRFTARRR
jgi:hypothetical protein